MAASQKGRREVLSPVIAPVRAALRDLDPSEVPASLRRVVAHTSARLPPPLERSLFTELDKNEWLRERLLEEVGDDADHDVVVFLERKPGWWMTFIDRAAGSAGEDDAVAGLTRKLERIEQKLAESKRRVAKLRESERETRDQLKFARAKLRAAESRPQPSAEKAALEARVEQLEAQLEDSEARRMSADGRLEDLKRRIRTKAVPASTETREIRNGGVNDPVEAARRLDLQAAALGAAVRAGVAPPEAVEQVEEQPELPQLPKGVAPDSVDAIRWLTQVETAVSLVVDGYNVTFLFDESDWVMPELRGRLVGALERLLRTSRSAHRLIVVFDSSHERGEAVTTAGGVDVRFSAGEESADDAIVALAEQLRLPIFVVTNDRELRERVARVGAEPLWGDALVEWIATG